MKNDITDLKAIEYEHPFDQEALNALKGTPGLEVACKLIIAKGYEKIIITQHTGSCLRVNKDNMADLFEIFLECCKILNMENIPLLYIKQGYEINAYTVGNDNPIVVLNSGAIDFLSQNELRYLIGHELGHIKSKHMLYHMLGELLKNGGTILGQTTLGLGNILTFSFETALYYWSRMSEFTADRAGLLSCQNIESVASIMMKMSGLPLSYHNQVDPNEFIKQAEEFQSLDFDSLNKFWRIAMQLNQTHPWTVMRTSELIKWTETGAYDELTKYRNPKIEVISTHGRKITCPNCQNEISLTEKTCPQCGEKNSKIIIKR